MKGITSREVDNGSFWTWKGIVGGGKRKKADKRFSVTEFLQENGRKLEKSMEGPGAGVGIGCGAGLGMGVVGGLGIGGVSDWNQLRMVFGIGIGCGVGIGFGYGQGFGFGISFESLQSKLFEPQVDSSSMRNPILLS